MFPELVEELKNLLEKEDEPLLVEQQISSLQIIDRCRCGDDFCATFYIVPKPKGAWGTGHETLSLDAEKGHLNVDIVNGKIVEVEVLYRNEIREKLLCYFP